MLWDDPVRRDGYGNMAVDEWLLESVDVPVLRVYGWQEGWGSFGYFVEDQEAARALEGLRRVRRRTGGGIVDHREDWTYTLVVPKGEPLADCRGGDSYRRIHEALAAALSPGKATLTLAPDRGPVRGGECFVHPAEHDVMDLAGRKLAGAGQRRTLHGLLHQGSAAIQPEGPLAKRFARALAREVEEFSPIVDEGEVERRADRYRDPSWAHRR